MTHIYFHVSTSPFQGYSAVRPSIRYTLAGEPGDVQSSAAADSRFGGTASISPDKYVRFAPVVREPSVQEDARSREWEIPRIEVPRSFSPVSAFRRGAASTSPSPSTPQYAYSFSASADESRNRPAPLNSLFFSNAPADETRYRPAPSSSANFSADERTDDSGSISFAQLRARTRSPPILSPPETDAFGRPTTPSIRQSSVWGSEPTLTRASPALGASFRAHSPLPESFSAPQRQSLYGSDEDYLPAPSPFQSSFRSVSPLPDSTFHKPKPSIYSTAVPASPSLRLPELYDTPRTPTVGVSFAPPRPASRIGVSFDSTPSPPPSPSF